MRRAAAPLAVLVLAGCGGDGETTTVTVATTLAETSAPLPPSSFPEDGILPVDDFNAYTAAIDEHWERDLGSVVGAFVGAGLIDSTRRSFEATTRGEGSSATATLVLDGLFDDSIRALRYDAELRRRQNGTWELLSATWSQACRTDRGHQDFTPGPCL